MAVTRITGMVTGMDTDQLVKDLMKIEQTKYDKIYKEKQLLEWEQEAYRSTISTVDAFQDQYFDILNKENYMMSSTAYSAFSSTTLVNGESKSYVSVTGTADMQSSSHKISSVSLATNDTWKTNESDVGSVKSGKLTSAELDTLKADGLSFNISIDGKLEKIEITDPELAAIGSVDDLVSALNTEIQNVFGTGYSDVVSKVTEGVDEFIKFDKVGSTVGLYQEAGSTSLSALAITSGTKNDSYKNESLESVFGLTDADLDDFSINGVSISGLTKDTTVKQFMDEVNRSTAGVTLTFDSLDNKFVMKSNNTGTVNDIDFSSSADATTVFTSMGFLDGGGTAVDRTAAQNATIVLDGKTIVKADNSFTVEGVKYTLNEAYDGTDGDIDIALQNNTDEVAERITKFVEDYNALIKTLNASVDERENRDYEPLTEEERKSLSEDQIENWESEAKKGLLHRDTAITDMLEKMRRAMYESVESAGMSLFDIGITTSDKYSDDGKLVIDQTKLKDSLENDFESVVKFFTAESDNDYLEEGKASERYSENGLMHRINDIMNDAVRTQRDTDGKKGNIVEKAGILGDASAGTNTLTLQLKDYDNRLTDMLRFLSDKEESYYLEFARMETALQELQSQTSSLTSALG